MAAANVILLEVQPRNTATGARTTVRLAGGGAAFPYRYGGNDWQAGIREVPATIAQLDYTGTDLGTGAVPQALALDWAASSKAALDAVLNRHWQGAPFTIYLGPENAAGTLPPVLITGTVLRGTIADSVLQLAMADPAADLQRPILVDTFAGTGGVEGPAEWEGRVKRRAWGYCYNVEGFGIDTANNIYSFTDPARPLNAISDVRDKGASITIQATVAWAGTVAATYAALQAASVTAGQCKIAPSIGMVKMWTRPAGILTADVNGEDNVATSNAATTPARLAQAIVAARGGPAFTGTTVADAVTLRNLSAGFLAADLQATIAQALDDILGGVSLYWVLDAAGTIRIGEWTFGASQGSFVSDHVDRVASFPPLQKRKLGYRRNNRQMAAGDLAAILTYSDGSTLDSLQPAQAGATLGAAWGTTLTGRPSNLAALSGSEGVNNAGVSISAGGALAGAGGGQVTGVGLDAAGSGAGDSILNRTIYLNSGKLATPGWGDIFSTIIANTYVGLNGVQLTADGGITALGAVSNAGISISASGALAGAAGGQVTIGGLGYTGALNATLGASWAVNLTGRPGNVAALAGGEAINNATISIAANGAIAGAGGGQVTISGLGFTGELNADLTLVVSGSKTVQIAFDYLGSVKAGQLPLDVPFKLANLSGADLTTAASWAGVLRSGTATFTPTVGSPNATGILNVTAMSADAVIEMQATYSGKTVKGAAASLVKNQDAPPVGGGGTGGSGTSASTSTISQSTSASYGAANTSVLSVKAGAAGQVACSFPDTFQRVTSGIGNAYGKWQWRVVGGSFADITSETPAGDTSFKSGPPDYEETGGTMNCTMTKAGLTNGTTYEFQLLLRSGGAYTLNHYGTASAVGS